ncbi:hypothetical protein HOP50_04g35090 [Chloropicon primus]|uniref:Uncharacterized protein n=2 Tax=Chloropicon primus TaxID=1764295 RepID=A0A5B8MLT6_9CHLO|nr:hypothetical protein A3770_04p35020 [Chloropicon primus]UPR00195.1 hypothetical protein HOP50_04g35090 [Chloropicon primus]|eukprot:QDZ20984.1 hypothetical protein A3770_04p35020 [Chloropicon primus]
MVGSNLLSALKKKARRYSFGDRSPGRFYKGKATPSPGNTEGKSPHDGVAGHSASSTPKLTTPRQIAIQPKTMDAGSLDKPVPGVPRRQPLQTQASSGKAKDGGVTLALDLSSPSEGVLVETGVLVEEGAVDGRAGAQGVGGEEACTPSSNTSDTGLSLHISQARFGNDLVGLQGEDNEIVGSPGGRVASPRYPQALAQDGDAIGWSESTTKMAGDAEALLEMELRQLTSRYEVLKKKTDEKALLFDATNSHQKSGGPKSSRMNKETKAEKQRLKEYEKKALEHARKLLKKKQENSKPDLFDSTNKDSAGKRKTAEKNRQRWQRAQRSALSMTPLQDQRGTKTNAMLRRLSMILRENAKESIYLHSPSPLQENMNGSAIRPSPSPAFSGASEVCLSLEDLMGTSVSSKKGLENSAYSSMKKKTNFAIELASAAKSKSVEVSLVSMMAEAEALAREVKLVTQDEHWTPNVDALTTPSHVLDGSSGKPIGRNLMQEFGSRTSVKSKASLQSEGVSGSATKAEEADSGARMLVRHHRNKSAPTIFNDLNSPEFEATPKSSVGEMDGEASTAALELPMPTNDKSSEVTPLNPKVATPMDSPSVSRKSSPIAAMNQVEEDSPVTGLVIEPSEEESVGSIHKQAPAARVGDVEESQVELGVKDAKARTKNANKENKRDDARAGEKQGKKGNAWFSCLPCLSL